MNNKRQIDMMGDHLFRNIFLFAYPLIISNLCQRLFNTADTLIVGRFSGATAMAAVGATGSLVGLLTWGLGGFSIGADVVVARLFGAHDDEGVRKSVHTAYFIAITAGLITAVAGLVFSTPVLKLMGTPSEILDAASLYCRIYFFGLFFNVVYNFGAACMRSSGDTRRPTIFMLISGVMNVLLNIFFVCVLKKSVAGVALATVIAQIFAAFMVTYCLIKEKGVLHLNLAKIRPDAHLAKQMIFIGLPSMLQNTMFSISNIVVQSSINAFGTIVVAANSAASTIEGFVYVNTASVNQTCITFTGQNNGAGNKKNIVKVLLACLFLQSVIGFAIGTVLYVNGHFMMNLFTTDETVISAGIIRLKIVVWWVFLNGIADVFASSLRAIGYSILPTAMTLLGICGFRLLYIFLFLPGHNTLDMLYMCYPISWIITSIILMVMWIMIMREKGK